MIELSLEELKLLFDFVNISEQGKGYIIEIHDERVKRLKGLGLIQFKQCKKYLKENKGFYIASGSGKCLVYESQEYANDILNEWNKSLSSKL